MLKTEILLDGLGFPEGPRWHDGKLWFSDMGTCRVMTVDLSGFAETVVEVPEQPSGLGWLPDNRLLVVSMKDRRLLRLDPDARPVQWGAPDVRCGLPLRDPGRFQPVMTVAARPGWVMAGTEDQRLGRIKK